MKAGSNPTETGALVIIAFAVTLFFLLAGIAVMTIGMWFGLPVLVRSGQVTKIQEQCRREKLIALTFDDGPNPHMTEKVLDMLDELDVKATFFMIGNLVTRNGDLARRVVAEDHQIASHTQDHLDAWRVNPIRGIRDFWTGMRTLKDRELAVSLFRPPKGNATLGTLLSCWMGGCKMIWWTHDSGDTGFGSGKCEMGISEILKKVFSGGKKMVQGEQEALPEMREDLLRSLEVEGGVVLLHDGERAFESCKTLTLECTRDIVERAKKNGFRFVTLEELV